ncbi:MAG: type I DNA topoisomerase [Gemmatimonadetes bacterium]|nr:type I DNA topoisomerase [Gemmatimonadota bacterium]NNK65078.1 type I DNA topoisomerase [Gemmatimonadota bacterium]
MPPATKDLVIVESPAKARTIGRYLGDGYEVAASVGHVMDLPRKELGVDVERGFEPTYEIIRGKGKVITGLKQKARKARRIILATDPDREGEAIAGHVAEQLGYRRDPDRFQRVQFREVTKSAVKAALERPGALDIPKIEAQQARRILDRLVGYRVSPFLWKPIRPGLSAGRVQTVALRLICEREDEVRAFEATEYWSITAHLRARDQAFEAKLHKIDGRSFQLGNADQAGEAVADIEGVPFDVTDVKRRERRKNPAAPFTTSTLQQEAAKRLRFSARRTMSTAQRLYEGVEVGGRGAVGLITYMRTDSTRVSATAVAAARAFVEDSFGRDYLPASPRMWGGKKQKGAQEAHEAIRPTDVAITPAEAARALKSDAARLYELIWLRFVASQMAPAVYDTTTVDFALVGASGREYRYRATGSVVKFAGFTRLYLEATEEGDHRRLDDLDPLPPLARGDGTELERIDPRQHFTQPPPRFSEASLVKQLEALGIGRPSTYAAIISTLVDRDYVVLEKRRFTPTDLGEVVAKLLVKVFPDIFDVAFTSRMEGELDRVEGGETGWRELLGDFYPRLERRLESGDAVSEEVLKEIFEAEGEVCETCGAPMVVKFNKRGSFLGCSNYPECSHTRSLEGAIDEVVGQDPADGRDVRVKVGPYGPYVERAAAPGEKKPHRVSLPKDIDPEAVTLEVALRYLSLPRTLGTDATSGEEVVAGLGRYGPFVRRGKSYASLGSNDELFGVTLEEALEKVRERETSGGRTVLAELGAHPESGAPVRVLEGRYGPYVTDGSLNANVPKSVDPATVDLDTAVDLLRKRAARGKGRGRGGRKGGGRTAGRKGGRGGSRKKGG